MRVNRKEFEIGNGLILVVALPVRTAKMPKGYVEIKSRGGDWKATFYASSREFANILYLLTENAKKELANFCLLVYSSRVLMYSAEGTKYLWDYVKQMEQNATASEDEKQNKEDLEAVKAMYNV